MSQTARLPINLVRLPPHVGPRGKRVTVPHDRTSDEVALLDAQGLANTLDSELARAARHELPLTLCLLEVCGLPIGGNTTLTARVQRAAKAALRERIRKEDRAAQLAPLKFAVVAVETAEGEAFADSLAEHVTKWLTRIGTEASRLFVATAAVDCQYDELSREELIEEAEKALLAASHTAFLRKSA